MAYLAICAISGFLAGAVAAGWAAEKREQKLILAIKELQGPPRALGPAAGRSGEIAAWNRGHVTRTTHPKDKTWDATSTSQ